MIKIIMSIIILIPACLVVIDLPLFCSDETPALTTIEKGLKSGSQDTDALKEIKNRKAYVRDAAIPNFDGGNMVGHKNSKRERKINNQRNYATNAQKKAKYYWNYQWN